MDAAMEEAAEDLLGRDPSSEAYTKIVGNLKTMSEAQAYKRSNAPTLDPNQVLKCLVVIGTTVLALEYEQIRPIATKVFSKIPRLL